MGDAALADFFAKKNKKKVKGSNLNNAATNAKTEDKKTKTTSKEEEEWQEEQVVAATIQVAAPGKLIRDEDNKPEEDEPKRAWGNAKGRSEGATQQHNDKKNPTPAMSVHSSTNINIDDGSEPKVNIKTTKNLFAALEDHQDDDEDAANKRPKEIKPVMVQKQKGEREKVAIQREVDKFGAGKKKDDEKKDDGKKRKDDGKKKKDADEDEEGGEDHDEEGADADGAEDAPEEPKNKKEEKKKAHEPEAVETVVEEDENEDLNIKRDLAAEKAKYQGRKRLPLVTLPPEEYEERKMKKQPVVAKSSKKKGANVDEEDFENDTKNKNRILREWDGDN